MLEPTLTDERLAELEQLRGYAAKYGFSVHEFVIADVLRDLLAEVARLKALVAGPGLPPGTCPRCLGDGMYTDDFGIIRDGNCKDCGGTGVVKP